MICVGVGNKKWAGPGAFFSLHDLWMGEKAKQDLGWLYSACLCVMCMCSTYAQAHIQYNTGDGGMHSLKATGRQTQL